MAGSINSVVIVGNLTRDPELRATPSGTSVCSLRIAVNDRVKDPTSGEWGDKPNYFDVDVFGGQGERCAQYLARGPSGRRRRPPALARVGDAGRPEASGRVHRRRQRAVHRPARGRRGRRRLRPAAGRLTAARRPAAGRRARAGTRGPVAGRHRRARGRHPVLSTMRSRLRAL